jgi:hypothetical protein
MPTTNAVKLARAEELIAKQEKTIERLTEDREHFMVKHAEAEMKLREAELKAKDHPLLAHDLALAIGALAQVGAATLGNGNRLPFRSSIGRAANRDDSDEATQRWMIGGGRSHD